MVAHPSLGPSTAVRRLRRSRLPHLLAASLAAYVALPACFSTPGATPADRWASLMQTDKAFKWHAEKHLSALGIESRKPEEMTAEVLEDFVTRYSDGSLERDDMTTAELAEKLKQSWTADSAVFWQWQRFCKDIVPYPIRSPQKIAARYVQQFLDEQSAGLLEKVPLVAEDGVEKLLLLRKSVNSREWRNACNGLSYGKQNPNHFPAEIAEHFLASFDTVKCKPPKPSQGVNPQLIDQAVFGPKRDLHAIVSKHLSLHLQRGPEKTDIIYEIESEVSPFTARVTLTEELRGALNIGADVPLSFRGAEVAAEGASKKQTEKSRKDAEKSAAAEALQALKAMSS